MIGRRKKILGRPRSSVLLGSTALKADMVSDFFSIADISAPPATGKEGNSGHLTARSTSCQPVIPEWGSNESGQRLETEPVAKFQISRNHNSTEILFNPPMYFLASMYTDFIVPVDLS
jgi:hypothetical protein